MQSENAYISSHTSSLHNKPIYNEARENDQVVQSRLGQTGKDVYISSSTKLHEKFTSL